MLEIILIILLLLLLINLGVPLFLLIGTMSLVLFYIYVDIEAFAMIMNMFDSVNRQALLAIPLYVFAGAIMAKGEIAHRLISLAKNSFGWLPGGLAVAGVIACIFFGAISGSSPVTLIAVGSVMYPAMIKSGYPEKMALGTLTTSGSLGILIPPSIPMIVFAIITSADVNKLFIAGIVPGLMAGLLLILISMLFGIKYRLPVQAFSLSLFLNSLLKSLPALMMPIIILGGIYFGIYNVMEAAAVGAVYAIAIEMLYYREMKWKNVVDTLYESVTILGMIFIIIAMATIFNYYLVLVEAPFILLDWIENTVDSKYTFLFMVILLLLIVGLFMDVISAILIIAPLLVYPAMVYEVDILHLGIIFILALEIGYLTPPVGINLFVSSGFFNQPFNKVVVSVLPYLLALLIVLVIVTFYPEVVFWLIKK